MVHHLSPPVIYQVHYSDNGEGLTKPKWKPHSDKKQKLKFSVLESIKSMIMVLEHGENFKALVEVFAAEKHHSGFHFHPLMVILKDIKGVPSKYILIFNNITLFLPDFLTLLETFLQTYYLFQFEFPSESSHICYFLGKYFYNFPLEQIPGLIGIQKVLDILK